ncbi:MAG: PQQ-binding-like beta-propeller repeat protein [bacterium]
MRKLFSVVVLLVLTVSQLMAQLADTAWPLSRHDLQRTGLSTFVGPNAPTIKWVDAYTESSESSCAIGTDGTIYAGCSASYLHAYNPDNGKSKWIKSMSRKIKSGPAIGADGTIYFGCDNFFALNNTGSVKWTFKTGGAINSSPAIGADGTIFVGCDDKNVYAIKADGTQKWKFATNGSVFSSPAISSDGTVIYIGSDDSNVYAINSADGTQKWIYTTGGLVKSTPAVDKNGTIYVGSRDKNLYALNPTDGSKKWSFTAGGELDSSPAIAADGTIYIGCTDKNIYAVNSTDGSKKWTFLTGGSIITNPVIDANGVVYVASENVYAIKSDGTQKWVFTTAARTDASPGIGSDGTLYIGNIAIGTSKATLGITSPNGGEKWLQGTTNQITWTADFTGNVKIELYKGNVLNSTIANNTTNSGSYKWAIPARQIAGNDYKVKISPVVFSTTFAMSAANFTIGSGGANVTPTLTLTGPNGGQQWEQSSTHTINWTSYGAPGDVKIELFKGGVLDSTISAGTPDTKSFSWDIPAGQTIGSDYKIKISSVGNPLISSKSVSNFSIIALPTITVTSPNGGEIWVQGSSQSINWKSTGSISNVKIEFLYNDTPSNVIINNMSNNGSYTWTIPFSQTPGNNYKIRVSSITNASSLDTSNADFSITQYFAAPSLLSPTNNSTRIVAPVTLTWQSVTNAVSYDYELYNVASSTVPIESNNVPDTSAIIQYNLLPGAKYSWQVRAVDANNVKSAFSPRWSFTVLDLPIIGTPILTLPADNASFVNTSPALVWQPAANATVYSVDVATDSAFTKSIVNVTNVTAATYQLSNLSNNTKYYWRVKGGDGTRWGSAATASFTTMVKQRISMPTLISPLNTIKDVPANTTLSWLAVNEAVSYTLQYAPNNSFTNAVVLNSTSLSVDVALLANTRYYWHVKAIDADGKESNWSSTWYFNTLADTVQLDAPTLITPADTAIDVPINTTFSWTPVTNATAYDIEISINAKLVPSAVYSTTATSLAKLLTNNKTYYWRVRGKQNTTTGTWSAVGNFTTVAFVSTAGVDAAIANSKNLNTLTGYGIVNSDGAYQSLTLDQPINRQSEFVVMVKNTGNLPDSFQISTSSIVKTKWKINIFDISGIDRTQKVFKGGWVTYSVKPGDTVKLVVRFSAASGQVIDASNPPTQTILLTALSINDMTIGTVPVASDTVSATAILTRIQK